VSYGDVAWRFGRRYIGWPTYALARPRLYGGDRLPREGGVVVASNHLHWIDIPVLGILSPRNLTFVAKVEALRVPLAGRYIASFGTIAVRRGKSDRDAVRAMREAAREGRALGLFVEGTRQLTGHPGVAQPGAAMIAVQEEVPVVPTAIYGTQFWRPGNFAPCSVAFGKPVRFDGVAKNGRGYREATAEIERRVHALFDWLAGVHEQGRPRGLEPPL